MLSRICITKVRICNCVVLSSFLEPLCFPFAKLTHYIYFFLIVILAGSFENSAIISLNLPDSLETIGTFAFKGCVGLTDVTIPPYVRAIFQASFQACTYLSSLMFDDIKHSLLISIGNFAFFGTSITDVTLPFGTMTTTGLYAFPVNSSVAYEQQPAASAPSPSPPLPFAPSPEGVSPSTSHTPSLSPVMSGIVGAFGGMVLGIVATLVVYRIGPCQRTSRNLVDEKETLLVGLEGNESEGHQTSKQQIEREYLPLNSAKDETV